MFLRSADSELHTHCNSLTYQNYHTATSLSIQKFLLFSIFSIPFFPLSPILPKAPVHVKSREENKSLSARTTLFVRRPMPRMPASTQALSPRQDNGSHSCSYYQLIHCATRTYKRTEVAAGAGADYRTSWLVASDHREKSAAERDANPREADTTRR